VSREILAFGAFAGLASLQVASLWFAPLHRLLGPDGQSAVLTGVVLAGLAGVASSVFVYHATRRAFWSAPGVAFKFATTATLLGLATTIVSFRWGAAALPASAEASVSSFAGTLAACLVGASVLKLGVEAAFLRHAGGERLDDRKRSALLMTRDLRTYTIARFAALVAGGVILPLCALAGPRTEIAAVVVAAVSLLLLLAGELLERLLFFAAAVSPGMPGGVS
jgi:DMSO reductase anchor subunit